MSKDFNFIDPAPRISLPAIVFLSLLATFVFLSSTLTSNFEVISGESVEQETSVAQEVPEIDIVGKIDQAVALLKNSSPLSYQLKPRSKEALKRQVALAILDKKSGEIFEKRFWIGDNGPEIYGNDYLDFIPDNNPAALVKVNWWNSFNSDYELDDESLAVVANKYLLPSSILNGLSEKTADPYSEIVYVPYSKNIHHSALIGQGMDYLKQKINIAFAELDTEKVLSKSLPGRLATSAADRDFVKNIILVEHIDPEKFLSAQDDGRELTERVLVVLGANKEIAYRYTGSPAGANGLAQFIKSTYKTMVTKYPEAKLHEDYELGMADHVNAIKAMVLFFDAHKKELENKITRGDVIKNIGVTEEMLAAAYNGGPKRVAQSVNKFGAAWISSQLDLPQSRTIFRRETIDYLKKFRSIQNLDLF